MNLRTTNSNNKINKREWTESSKDVHIPTISIWIKISLFLSFHSADLLFCVCYVHELMFTGWTGWNFKTIFFVVLICFVNWNQCEQEKILIVALNVEPPLTIDGGIPRIENDKS